MNKYNNKLCKITIKIITISELFHPKKLLKMLIKWKLKKKMIKITILNFLKKMKKIIKMKIIIIIYKKISKKYNQI